MCLAVHRCIWLLASTTILTVSAQVPAQGVREFGVPRGKLPLRGFGNPTSEEALRLRFPEAAAAIVGDDRSLARNQVSRTDANGDGMVTEQEWAESGFQTPRHFFYHDLNGDGILTVYEHSIGAARWRRRNERRADDRESTERSARQQARRPAPSYAAIKEAPEVDPQVAARREQVQRLAEYLLRVYDLNEDGSLERPEFRRRSSRYGNSVVPRQSSAFGNIGSADRNFDGTIELDELTAWLRTRLPPLSRLALPFQAHDANRDSQVTYQEYAQGNHPLGAFTRWDRNNDGLITPRESQSPHDDERRYENNRSFVIRPGASVVSDIWVEDDVPIDRLRVMVRISKETDEYTELLLIGPHGDRVLLFAGDGWRPWRGSQLLRGIVFDDAAPQIDQTLEQPPPERVLRPPGAGSGDATGLSRFAGSSTRGNWRIVVRNQNTIPGVLLHWSLRVTPAEESSR